ncbi:MAG: hypothetical protein KIY12_03250, partial [Thermoplasmata archaeon]|nr:hypothetical protein [Candidatus Sysuiplasma superficiale]
FPGREKERREPLTDMWACSAGRFAGSGGNGAGSHFISILNHRQVRGWMRRQAGEGQTCGFPLTQFRKYG